MQAASSIVSDFVGTVTSTLSTTDAVLVFCAVACVAYMQVTRTKTKKVPYANHGDSVWGKKPSNKMYYDSDKSTEAGDYSTSEFSDRNSHSDASGMSRRRMPAGARSQNAPHLNANAATFVPGYTRDQSTGLMPGMPENNQQIRASINALKGALESWESKLPAANANESMNDGSALLDSLAKLTPEQAAMVRSMLDNKVGEAGQHQRSFTPFGAPSPWKKESYHGRSYHTFAKHPIRHEVYAEGEEENSLRTHLRDLANIPNDRVLMVRKINVFGLDSAVPLQKYFSKFGEVDEVFVAPTRSKPGRGADVNRVRVRPAPLGFVTMTTAEAAQAVLALGDAHCIEGKNIGVFPFTSHGIDATE